MTEKRQRMQIINNRKELRKLCRLSGQVINLLHNTTMVITKPISHLNELILKRIQTVNRSTRKSTFLDYTFQKLTSDSTEYSKVTVTKGSLKKSFCITTNYRDYITIYFVDMFLKFREGKLKELKIHTIFLKLIVSSN